jgi:hypothetical protein
MRLFRLFLYGVLRSSPSGGLTSGPLAARVDALACSVEAKSLARSSLGLLLAPIHSIGVALL